MGSDKKAQPLFQSPDMASRVLGVHITTLRRWIAAGLVPVRQVAGPGGRMLIPTSWIERQQNEWAEPAWTVMKDDES